MQGVESMKAHTVCTMCAVSRANKYLLCSILLGGHHLNSPSNGGSRHKDSAADHHDLLERVVGPSIISFKRLSFGNIDVQWEHRKTAACRSRNPSHVFACYFRIKGSDVRKGNRILSRTSKHHTEYTDIRYTEGTPISVLICPGAVARKRRSTGLSEMDRILSADRHGLCVCVVCYPFSRRSRDGRVNITGPDAQCVL